MAVEQLVVWSVSQEAKVVVESVSVIVDTLCHTLVNGYQFP